MRERRLFVSRKVLFVVSSARCYCSCIDRVLLHRISFMVSVSKGGSFPPAFLHACTFFLRVTRRETKEEKEKLCHLLRDREGEVRLRVFFSRRFHTTFMSAVHIDEGSNGVGYLHCVWRWLELLCPQKKKNNQNYLPCTWVRRE